MKNQSDSVVAAFHSYKSQLDEMVGLCGRYVAVGDDNEPPLWLVAFDGCPEPGSITTFTYGVSLVRHSSWKRGVPELVISLNTTDDDWSLSLGSIAALLRGGCPFALGNVLRCGSPLASETAMSAYFLFWPTILQQDQQQLSLDQETINFLQAYPIFESEIELIDRVGAERFFMTEGLDFSDVSRSPQA